MPATTLGGSTQAVLGLTGNGATLNIGGNTNALTIGGYGYSRALTFTIGTGATTLLCDTIHNSVRSMPLSTSDTLTLSALVGTATPTAMYDALNQVSPVFARVRAILIELLTTGDAVGPSDPAATAAVSITIGNAVAAKWLQLVDSTGTFTLLNGETYAKATRSAAGMVVASGTADQLKILNNSGAVAAVYRLIIFGCST